MITLSDRLLAVARMVRQGESIADIGTDHGFLPMYLHEHQISPRLILTDLNAGPLEKARENLAARAPGFAPELRPGDGLAPLAAGEVDAVVISGLGGLTIADILAADPEKTKSFRRYILGPETAEDKLRAFLFDQGFAILAEQLVRDRGRIYQILAAAPNPLEGLSAEERAAVRAHFERDMLFEISPMLIFEKDPLLPDLLAEKIRVEEAILAETAAAATERSKERKTEAEQRLRKLKLLQRQA